MRYFTAVVLAVVTQIASADTLIHAGRLIDGESGRAVTERTVRIDGTTIVALEEGYSAPAAGDRVIDLTEHTVLPGLMDTHVHLTSDYTPDSDESGVLACASPKPTLTAEPDDRPVPLHVCDGTR